MHWLREQMRYIHLDFHTPRGVKVATKYDEKKFVDVLKKTGADSIAIFVKDHYGHAYYPSKLGNMHPDLKLDLFGSMLFASKKAGFRVFAYISVGWDNWVADKFPHWMQVDKEGTPLLAGFWRFICLNSPYIEEYLFPQIGEVLENYDADGLWLDIVFFTEGACFCEYCIKGMKEQGVNPYNEKEHLLFNDSCIKKFLERTYALAKKIKPSVVVSYNNLVKIGARDFLPYLDYWWIEALPHGWGLYYLPLYARYLRTLGKPLAGLTARFQKSWGDFGSLKPREHLLWEAGEMLVNGTAVGIGDQMNPDGTLEEAVYNRIGEVFAFVKEREKWCVGAESVPYVAILTSKQEGTFGMGKPSTSLLGVVEILMELHIHFDIVDEESVLSPYSLVILPDVSHISTQTMEKIKAYLRDGGSVFLSLSPEVDETVSSLLGNKTVIERFPFSLGYLRLESPRISEDIPNMDLIIWEKPVLIKNSKGKELASLVAPLMERSKESFFSHAQAPAGNDTGCPGIILKPIGKGKLLVFAFPLFNDFHQNDYTVHKQIFRNAFEILLSRRKRLLEVQAPPNVEVSLMKKDNNYIIHFLNLSINRKGKLCEEFVPLERGVSFRLLLPYPPSRVYYAPEEMPLPRWQWLESPKGDYRILKGRVRPFDTHIMVVVEV